MSHALTAAQIAAFIAEMRKSRAGSQYQIIADAPWIAALREALKQ